MRSKIASVIGAAIALSLSKAAHAEFINNYSQWRDLDKTNKSLYAAGLMDGGGVVDGYFDIRNDKVHAARMDGMVKCVTDNHLNSELLSEMIENAYAHDVKQWSNPPDSVLVTEMEKLCQPWLERSRKRLGADH